MSLRLGTRASALAQWQAEWVAARLREHGHDIELVLISTHGDATQGQADQSSEGAPIGNLGTVGVFTKELQRALLEGRIDLAVHSLKDLPTDPVDGLMLAAVPERESVFDVLISREGHPLNKLPSGTVIGTGSLRRQAQLLRARPDLQMANIRGNVDSRLRKVREGQFDAIVLAEAGIRRLGATEQITQILPLDLMLPAVGQGALGIETRATDATTQSIVQLLNHPVTHAAVTAERSLLAMLRGGCLAPVGAWARTEAPGRLALTAKIVAIDGSRELIATTASPLEEAKQLGLRVAQQLLAEGGAKLIDEARSA
jgi:hydroxymethylbilane synthase